MTDFRNLLTFMSHSNGAVDAVRCENNPFLHIQISHVERVLVKG